MPLNPNIALSVKGIEVQDPLAQYGKLAAIQNAQNQNALAQYQLGTAQRAETAQNVLADAYSKSVDPTTGKIDYNKLNSLVAAGGGGAQLPANQKSRMEQETAALTQQETGFKVQKAKKDFIAQAQRDTSQNPSDANITAYKEDLIANPLFSEQEKQQMIASSDRLLAMPINERKMFMSSQGATASELKPTVSVGRTGVVQTPAFGGAATVVPGTEAAFQATPGERMTDARARAQMAQSERQFQAQQTGGRDIVANTLTDAAGNVTQYNKFGEQIGEAKQGAGKPSATFEKTKAAKQELSRSISQVIPELEAITKEGGLIDQSTGSGIGRLADISAGFVGQATPGAIAIGKLKPVADLVMKMIPRFEGPQSDKDTQSYKEAAGQLADPAMPTKIRKAAALEVLRLMKARKDQFATSDMVEPAAPAAPSNIDALLNKYK